MKKTIITTFLLLLAYSLNATEYMFRHLEIKDGLSNHQVNNIFKDKEGFVWFSTASGLNRYDGTEVLSFRSYDFEKDAFADNYIYDVQQDYWGHLWIHTAQGYTLYDPTTEIFEKNLRNWMLNNGMDGTPELTFIDANKQMWIYIPTKGINLFIPQTKLLYTLFYSNELMPEGKLSSMAECREGILLLFENGKIACLNKENGKVKWELTTITQELGGAKHVGIQAMSDSDGDVWIYSSRGVWVYNPTEKRFKNQFTAPLKSSLHNQVQSITQDSNGNIWIGSKEAGIQVVNKKSLQATELVKKNDQIRSLPCNAIQSLYTDNHGTVWVGTATQGVSFYNESSFKFGFESLGDISSLKEDREGIIWFGNSNKGLFRWDKKKNQLEAISDAKGVLNTATITTLLHSKEGKCWIGTLNNGLLCYTNGAISYYESNPSTSNSLANNSIRSLVEDREGVIWIGTAGDGVQALDPKTNQFTSYNVTNAQIASNQIYSLCISQKNRLIIGTERGVSMLNLENKRVTPWSGNKSGNTTLSNLRVTQLYEDSRGLLWIGTYDGLNIYQQKNDELKVVPIDASKEKQTILGITEDANKNIWVTTPNQVASIIPTLNEREGYEFQTYLYGEKDGLQQGRFNPRCIDKTRSEELIFGGTYGINYINPSSISYNKVYPNVRFTHLYLSNQEIQIGEPYNGEIILKKSLNNQKEIVLAPLKEVLEIHFSTDDYIVPQGVSYIYKLDGFSDKWITSTNGKVSYTNLESGDYTLRVKAINSDGFGSGEEFRLGITITAPLTFTILRYLLYALVLIGIVVATYFIMRMQSVKRGRKRQLQEKEEELEEESYKAPIKVTKALHSGSKQSIKEEKNVEESVKSEEKKEAIGSSQEISAAIYTIDSIVTIEDEAEEMSAEYTAEESGELHTIQTIYLDNEGNESLEVIQTAVARTIDYEEEEEKEEEEKKLVETTQQMINSSKKLREKDYRPTLLVVDDNDDVLAFIHDHLQKEYHLVMAANGYDAWKLMETVTPQLIISDLEMPHIDGNELCRLVRSEEKLAKIPFILLLARQTVHTDEIAKEVDDTLTKPFNKASLVAKIQHLLENKSTESNGEGKEKVVNNTITTSDEKLVERAVKYVEKHLSNSELSVEDISKALGINRVNLYKKLSHVTGKTPAEFIRFIRLKRAAQLLEEGQFSRTEIAFQVGFTNQRSFEKFFEKAYGTSENNTEKEETEL